MILYTHDVCKHCHQCIDCGNCICLEGIKMIDKDEWDELKKDEQYGMIAKLFEKISGLEKRMKESEDKFAAHVCVSEFNPHKI